MADLDYAGVLSLLMGWVGEQVAVKVASVVGDGPVVEVDGTLASGWTEEPGYAALDDVVRFGFDEHGAAIYLDRSLFESARTDASGDWLEVLFGAVGVEVTRRTADADA